MDLETRAKELTARAPGFYDQVHAMLVAHREKWQERYDDMLTATASPMPNDKLAKIGTASIEQVLQDGEILYRTINGMVSRAILSGEHKPKRKEWTPEQRREGMAKLKKMRAYDGRV